MTSSEEVTSPPLLSLDEGPSPHGTASTSSEKRGKRKWLSSPAHFRPTATTNQPSNQPPTPHHLPLPRLLLPRTPPSLPPSLLSLRCWAGLIEHLHGDKEREREDLAQRSTALNRGRRRRKPETKIMVYEYFMLVQENYRRLSNRGWRRQTREDRAVWHSFHFGLCFF